MVRARLVFACLHFAFAPLAQAFDWGTATYEGRDYVSLYSFCSFYGFGYAAPGGNNYFNSRNGRHSIQLRAGSADAYIDGVHYVLSFPVESEGRDWLVSRMDTIKLFEPILRPDAVEDRHRIRGVVIDAGHGGSDNGAASRLGYEKNYALDTAYRLDSILREAGLQTVFTRRNDTFIDLYERAHIASLYPDYAFVSIHFNSAEAEARGLETYCLSPRGAASTSSRYLTRADIQELPGNDEDAVNILLASMVHSQIIRLNPGDSTADRGVKRARFVVIKQNVLPAILVEGGFVSNRMEAARVNQSSYRQALAEAIARGVLNFASVMGGHRYSAPEQEDQPRVSQPRVVYPVAPSAPSGLAKDSPAVRAQAVAPGSMHGSKSKKSKKTKKSKHATTGTTTPTSEEPSGPTKPESTAPALNLAEPKTPTPTPGAEKRGEEPDEPPTVNIYSPTPEKGGTNNAPREP